MTRILLTLLGVALLSPLAGCDSAEIDEVYDGPTVSFASTGTNVAEGDSVSVEVRLTGGTGQPVTVDVLLAEGATTATFNPRDPDGTLADTLTDVTAFGTDFATDSSGLRVQRVTFSGEPTETQTIRFEVIDDGDIEAAEQVVFALQNAQGARIGRTREFAATIGTLPLSIIRTYADNTPATVEGIVTRISGRFIWLEDDTGAIVVFSPAGTPIFDAAAAGEIEPGDRLQVKGRIDIFNQLIELAFVEDFAVIVEDEGLVAPQTVTLATLAANLGEYQSELVRIQNLTFQTTDTVFDTGSNSGSNYTITDPTGTMFTLRVSAGTQPIGTPIPTGPTTFTGVVGQFRADGQLTLTDRSELNP